MIDVSFDSTKTHLQDLLTQTDGGKLQLPDFQRDWVWDDDRIRSLLASVSISFQHIDAATGKNIVREPELFRPRADVDFYDEGPEDWDAEESLEEPVS